MIRDFPTYGWICKLNKGRVFSGSIGTHGEKGYFAVPVFQYKIWREEDTLHASCYIRKPDGEKIGQDEMECELSRENADAVDYSAPLEHAPQHGRSNRFANQSK